MLIHQRCLALITLFSGLFVAPLSAATDIAVVEMPPYAIKSESGAWRGPAVDLVRQAAEAANIEYRFVSAAKGAADVPQTATFPIYADARTASSTPISLPFHTDAIGLIGGKDNNIAPSFMKGLAGLLTLGFVSAVAGICVVLLVVGAVFWLVERKHNGDIAPNGGRLNGLGDGFWWAGVTATTIGYGDLVPRTTRGRIVAMLWMLFSMALTSIFTAYIVSLTGQQQAGGDRALTDAIKDKTVGYVSDGAVSPEDLTDAAARQAFPTGKAALTALKAGRIDMIAYPYRAAKGIAGSMTVERTKGSVAFPVVATGSNGALQVELDRIILSPAWQQRIANAFD